MEYGGRYAARALGHAAEDAEADLAHGAQKAVDDAEGGIEGAGCAMSFVPGTPVATPQGKKPIAALKVGDQVVAYDPQTGKATAKTVRATFVTHDTDLVDVTLRVTTTPAHDTAGTKRGAARAHDETVHTTANHPWLTTDHGWLPANFLRVGEPVRRADGSTATVAAIRAVPGAAPMWDLTVADLHDFAVGAGEYVVHNCGVSSVDPHDPKAFEITDWSGYPTNGDVGKPEGPFKLLEGDDYTDARAEGNRAARAYRRENGLPHEDQPHHIQPVKFGGDPTAPENLTPLTSPWPHQEYTNWWNGLQDEIESGNFQRIRFLNAGDD
jgi:hypothetical protein